MNYKTYEVKVYDDGSKRWILNGHLHREDGPAVEHDNGDKHWFLNGERHREDGPAVEYANGGKSWWINGKFLSKKEFNERMNSCDGKVVEIDGKKYKLTEV